ncbi:MAG TPA: alpha-galactosidase, partial [Opitutae bacterium]|nr:alpha-galactosidase [Opitutae bacterium]
RADGKDWDGLLHVNPRLKERALFSVFNPTNQAIERDILVPLYYAGLKDSAEFSINGASDTTRAKLDAASRAKIRLTLPPNSHTWVVFQE